jgi:DNA invertase Pin-like site-specific DNA recombinase
MPKPHPFAVVPADKARARASAKPQIRFTARLDRAQDETGQVAQLKAAGCDSKNIFREKISGATADRPQLKKLMNRLAAGDVVMVTRLDRLARSTRDLC